MPSRHRSRERALQILFQWDSRKESIDDAITAFYGTLSFEEGQTRPEPDEFVELLTRGVVEHISEIDKQLQQHAEHWRIERMSVVDRNVLRMAIHEMMFLQTPAPVAIDEAIELARRFSGEDSVQFINGVLDAAKKDIESAAGRGQG